MRARVRRLEVTSAETCPGIRDFIKPMMRYVKCHSCGGDVEICRDEEEGLCLDCGTTWARTEKEASCLDYCKYADKCREIIEARGK